MQRIFDQLGATLNPCPVFVAAAGNGALLVSPASVKGVSRSMRQRVVCPGSARGAGRSPIRGIHPCARGTPAEPIQCGTARFYGSSFAAAVLTGMLARDRDALRDSIRHLAGAHRRPQRALLDQIADRRLPGYDPELHGAGLAA